MSVWSSDSRSRVCSILLSSLIALGPTLTLSSNAFAKNSTSSAFVYQASSTSLTEGELHLFNQELSDAAHDTVGSMKYESAEVRLKDALLIVGCSSSDSLDCFQRLADFIGAARIYYFNVETDGGLYRVDLKYFDLATHTFERQEIMVRKSDDSPSIFHDAVVGFLSGKPLKTKLSIDGNEKGLSVAINDKRFGTLPQKIESLAPDTYSIRVFRNNSAVWDGSVKLPAQIPTALDVKMMPNQKIPLVTFRSGQVSETIPPKSSERIPGAYLDDESQGLAKVHWGAWTLLGVGAASIVGGAVVSGLVSKKNQEAKELYDKWTKDKSNSSYAKEQQAVIEDGKVYQRLQWVFYGIGIAAIAGGIVWMTYNLVSDGSDNKKTKSLALTDEDDSYKLLLPEPSKTKWSLSFAPSAVQSTLVW